MKASEIYNAFAQGEPLRSMHHTLMVNPMIFEQLSTKVAHKLPYSNVTECPQKGDVIELIVSGVPAEQQPESLLFVILAVTFGDHFGLKSRDCHLDLFPLTRQQPQADNQMSFEQMLEQGGGTIEIDGQQVPVEFIDADGRSTILGDVNEPPEDK